ncbi:hypothetical protein JJB98_10490 [Bradyrhizobium diazoefficiens]|nr:hypothetical protein JJB98_10490 [Bradyrhizobium diazoefficiens]
MDKTRNLNAALLASPGLSKFQAGAKLKIDGSIEGLALKEFFLLPSTIGAAFHCCELAWINGDHIGVHFLRGKNMSKV